MLFEMLAQRISCAVHITLDWIGRQGAIPIIASAYRTLSAGQSVLPLSVLDNCRQWTLVICHWRWKPIA